MSNLLDKASIILTPTAYDNGKALCVKPSDGSGDFDFSRNSAATRVNAQGLVENVQILSSNLVQNGDFSEEGSEEVSNGSFSQEGSELIIGGDFSNPSDWNLSGQNLSISNGKGISTGSNFGAQFKQTILTINKTYKLVFDIVDYTSGAIGLTANYYGVQQTFNSVGTHTAYFTSLNQTELRLYSENFIGSIDNVSVREVGQNWTLGTGWSIGEDKAVADGTTNNALASTVMSSVVGKSYKIDFTIDDYVTGNIRIYFGGAFTPFVNANGVYSFYIAATAVDTLATSAYGLFNGSITNISVKEVGQNWSFVNADISIGNDGLEIISKGGNRPQANQNISGLTIGNKYKLSAVAKRGTCVEPVEIEIAGINSPVETNKNNTTEFANIFYQFIATSTIHTIQAKIDDGTSTIGETAFFKSVSVIEITDDTSLPRINYEGFSYQDALGSEEVVNGTFSSDTAWNKGTGWSISGGSANGLATFDPIYQLISGFTAGKKYKVSFEITEVTNGFIRVYGYVGASGTFTKVLETPSQIGTYEVIFEFGGTNKNLMFYGSAGGGNFTGSIDNVSVKEYLGQEVVPDSGCGSWLWESQSTNLITQSELFSDASWVKSRSTYTSDAIKSPSGLINMGYLTEDTTATNTHYMRTFLTLTDGVDYTLSVFAKAKERNIICLGDNAAAQSNTGVWFDLTNGVVLTQRSGYVGSIKDFGNGIYRCSVIYSAAAARQYADIAISLSDGVNVYTGDGTSGVYIWGAQLEQQTYATSYIPTSGSTVTRNQDLCTNGGSLASINSTEGTLYFEGAVLDVDSSAGYITISNGVVNNNAIRLLYHNSNAVYFQKYVNGVRTTNLATTSITKTDFNKIAIRYNSTDVSVFVNGVNILNNADTNIISPNTLNVLGFATGENYNPFYGKTKALAVWKEALSDSELQSLTTI